MVDVVAVVVLMRLLGEDKAEYCHLIILIPVMYASRYPSAHGPDTQTA